MLQEFDRGARRNDPSTPLRPCFSRSIEAHVVTTLRLLKAMRKSKDDPHFGGEIVTFGTMIKIKGRICL